MHATHAPHSNTSHSCISLLHLTLSPCSRTSLSHPTLASHYLTTLLLSTPAPLLDPTSILHTLISHPTLSPPTLAPHLTPLLHLSHLTLSLHSCISFSHPSLTPSLALHSGTSHSHPTLASHSHISHSCTPLSHTPLTPPTLTSLSHPFLAPQLSPCSHTSHHSCTPLLCTPL